MAEEPPAAERPAVRDALTLLDLWIAERMDYGETPSLAIAVVHDGEVLWSQAYGHRDLARAEPATTTTRYRLGSVSKIFTATAILKLRDAGALDLDDPVVRHLPGFRVRNPFEGSPPMTIRHLLTHSSGLPREAPFPYWTTHRFPSWAEVEEVISGVELSHPPGEHYRYSNLGMATLGAVVEAAGGRPYAAYVRDEIAEPLGLSRTTADPGPTEQQELATAYMRRRPDGTRGIHDYYDTGGMRSMGNVTSTVEDLARFAAALLARDAVGSESEAVLLDGYTLREMQRPQFVYPSFSGSRGLGFIVRRDEGRTVASHGGWIGGHRSHLLLSPEEELGVVAMTNADDASPYPFTGQALELLSEALGRSEGAAAPVPPDPTWSRYVGLYSDPWDWHYRVLVLDGRLAVYEHGYPPSGDARDNLTLLSPDEGPHRFRMPDGDPFVFELDDQDRVVRIQRRSDYIFPVREGRPVLPP